MKDDARLDRIAARLIARLEGSRRRYLGNPERARNAFVAIADEHVDAAVEELEIATSQAEFLRREIRETFLPRYWRLAVGMTLLEDAGFGFGPFSTPLGRTFLFLGSLIVIGLLMLSPVRLVMAPLVVLLLAVPVLPDVIAWLYRGRYNARLEAMLGDLARIQDDARSGV